MDPRIQQLMQQLKAQGGQPGGMPQGAPQPGGMPQAGGQDMGDPQFDKNPFESILGGQSGSDMSQGMPGGTPGGQMGGMGLPPMGMSDQENPKEQAMPGDTAEDDSQKGVNPGGTKFVLGAIQQLNNFITDSTDRTEIATIRSVIALLTRLIEKDQQRQASITQQLAGRL